MKAENDNSLKIGIGITAALVVGLLLIKKSDNGNGYGYDPTGNNTQGNNSSAFNAKDAAEKLYNAMREMGTDEKAIMQVFQTVSVQNFTKVYNAFGKRSYNDQMGNQYNFSPFYDLPLHNLSYWLKSELSGSSFETLRIKYKSTNLI